MTYNRLFLYWYRFKLCGGGIEVIIYSLGGIIQSLKVPNAEGVYADVVLGYDTT